MAWGVGRFNRNPPSRSGHPQSYLIKCSRGVDWNPLASYIGLCAKIIILHCRDAIFKSKLMQWIQTFSGFWAGPRWGRLYRSPPPSWWGGSHCNLAKNPFLAFGPSGLALSRPPPCWNLTYTALPKRWSNACSRGHKLSISDFSQQKNVVLRQQGLVARA